MAVNASPTVPTESSIAAPSGGFSSWFRNIGDWLNSLSPSGASQYETDWTNITIASGYAIGGSTPQWKRIGKVYYFRGEIKPNPANFPSGNFTVNTSLTLSAAIPGLTNVFPADTVKTGWGPATAGPVRVWLQSAAISLFVPTGQTNVSYVALGALSGITVE